MKKIGLLLAALAAAVSVARAADILLSHDPGGATASSQGKGFVYGLRVSAPWDGGGYLTLNFPEHFTHRPHELGILRHSDERPTNLWQIAADGRAATLDVVSLTAPGIRCQAEIRTSTNAVNTTWRVVNDTSAPLDHVRGLFCHFFFKLTGFPRHQVGLEYAYVLRNGTWTKLKELACEKPESTVRFANSARAPEAKVSEFAKRLGGMVDEKIDSSLVVVTDKEGRRKIVLHWTPEGTILCNAGNACIHSDPRFDDVPPGGIVEAKGVLVFTEESLEDIRRRFSPQP